MSKHHYEDTVTRSDEGVFVLHTRTATYTGYEGFVTAWKVPMVPSDDGRQVRRFDGTEPDFLRVIAGDLDLLACTPETQALLVETGELLDRLHTPAGWERIDAA